MTDCGMAAWPAGTLLKRRTVAFADTPVLRADGTRAPLPVEVRVRVRSGSLRSPPRGDDPQAYQEAEVLGVVADDPNGGLIVLIYPRNWVRDASHRGSG